MKSRCKIQEESEKSEIQEEQEQITEFEQNSEIQENKGQVMKKGEWNDGRPSNLFHQSGPYFN